MDRDGNERALIAIICKTFFICVAPWESVIFADEQAKEYAETFMAPEYFVRTAQGIVVVK